MSLQELRNAKGEVTSIRATAGAVRGAKVRATFKVALYGSAAKATRAANAWIAKKRDELARDRNSVIAIPDSLRPDVIEALELLEPHHIRLVDAVRAYVKAGAGHIRDPWTFRQAVAHFIASRRDKGARAQYLRSLDDTLSMAAKTFQDRPLDEITTEDIEHWLRTRKKPLSPITWRNYRRDLAMVFKFSIEREHATRNPAKALPKPTQEKAAVHILTAAQVEELLNLADPIPRVYLAIMAFAGVRPFEMLQLNEISVDFLRLFIEIKGAHAKSRSRRLVTITPNLAAWLKSGVQHLGLMRDYWKLRRMITKTGIALSQDVLRHSFASHHLALYQDAAKTAHELGHRSSQMLFAHYRELVTHEAARAYFGIFPPP